MNTWFTEIMRDANERVLSDQELERVMVYYGGLPARLKAAEEVEQIEGELAGTLYGQLKKRFPHRPLYTRRFVQDVLESLRPMAQAMVADEPRLFRHRWVTHLARVVAELDLDPAEVRDVYEAVQSHLAARLGGHSRELLQPYFDELSDALAPAAAAR